MKTYALAFGCAVAAFLAMGFQMGLFTVSEGDDPGSGAPVIVEKKSEPATHFPEDLAAACRGVPVAQAADYDPANRQDHPVVFLFEDGKVHKQWQDTLDDDWRAEKVETTQLIVEVGKDQKTRLSIHHYTNGAPPVTRYQYELAVRVIAAKTGKVLGQNRFVSTPRQVRPVEPWELTALGRPITFTSVFQWVKSQALGGFGGGSAESNAKTGTAQAKSKR